MGSGILAGVFWALETVVLGRALTSFPNAGGEAALLVPFAAAFVHDAFSSLWAALLNVPHGGCRQAFRAARTRSGRTVMLAAVIGGPVGMTGYVLAVRYMGAAIGAVAGAIFPAVGAVLAHLFLKERMRWYRWIFLLLTIGGVWALSFSPQIEVRDFRLGAAGALLCALGWGTEAVLLAHGLRDEACGGGTALQLRQAASALAYAAVVLPATGGWPTVVRLLTTHAGRALLCLALAALCAALSYRFYYRAIRTVGASRAMALDMTYAAWALPFTALAYRDPHMFSVRTVVCMLVVVVCSVLTAADGSGRKNNREEMP